MIFEITYREPNTKNIVTIEQKFEDTVIEPDWDDGGLPITITAWEWADDYAYTLADKGYYDIKVKEKGNYEHGR